MERIQQSDLDACEKQWLIHVLANGMDGISTNLWTAVIESALNPRQISMVCRAFHQQILARMASNERESRIKILEEEAKDAQQRIDYAHQCLATSLKIVKESLQRIDSAQQRTARK